MTRRRQDYSTKSTRAERQACIDAKGAYYAEGSSRYHTWAGCAAGQVTLADSLTGGRPPGEAEWCGICRRHEAKEARRTGGSDGVR